MKKSISILICVLIVLLLSDNILFAADKATILVIQSYHTGNAWDDSYKLGLEKSLAARYKLVYFEMDTKRIPKDQVQKKADLAWDKYQSIKPALVILADDAALKNLGPKFGETKTPVVYLGINNNPRNYFKAIPANITGILERPLLLRSIANLRDIMPGIKNVLVLFDDDITAEIVKKEVFSNKDKLDVLGINVELRTIGDYSIWQNSVTSAKGNFDACIAGLYQTIKNKDQKVINAEEVINWTSQHAVVPTFAFWDFAVGSNKAIGGTVIYGEDMGEKAAEFVAQILEKGKSPSDLLPIFSDQGQFMFSKSQLAKWKITLPAKITAKTNYVE